MPQFLPAIASATGVASLLTTPVGAVSTIGGQTYNGLNALAVTGGSAATDIFLGGCVYTFDGYIRLYDATAGLPAGTTSIGGMAVTAAGLLCITTAAPASTAVSIGGIAVRMDGAVHVTGLVAPASFSATLLSTLVPQVFTGSSTPTYTRATTAYVATYLTTIAAGFTLQQCASGEARFTGARRLAQDSWSILDSNSVAITTGNGADSRWADAASNLGYLSEGAATNLLLWSNDLTNAAWVKTTMTTAFTSTGPDGVANGATRVTATAGNALCLQTYVAAASSRTSSFWVKRITGSGNFELTQDGAAFTVKTTTAGWTKVELNASILNATVGFRIVTNGDAFDIWCGQFEAGSESSSPIPTTTVAVTRNADVLTYSTASNLNTSTGTMYAEVTYNAYTSGDAIIVGDSGVASAPLYVNSDKFKCWDGTNIVVLSNTSYAPPQATPRKAASAWGAGGISGSVAGSAALSGSFDGTLNMTSISVGGYNSGVQTLKGTIRNFSIWTTKKTDAELQALTT